MDVQNAVKLAEPQLPDAVRQNGITILKANTDILGVVALTSTDPRYDAAYLTNYIKLYIEDEIKRVPGIGNALTFGGLEFSMLIQLDPDRMAQLGITTADVAAAVREQNATNPAGRVGREPAPEGTELTLPVTTLGRLKTPEQFADIVVRAKPDGSLVRIGDIGRVVLGSRNYDLAGRLNGSPTAPLLLYLRPGANALEVRRGGGASGWSELSRNFPRWSPVQDPVRHHAVRHRIHQRGRAYPGRGDAAGDPGGVHLPAELAGHADPDAGGAGQRDRHASWGCWCSASRSTC